MHQYFKFTAKIRRTARALAVNSVYGTRIAMALLPMLIALLNIGVNPARFQPGGASFNGEEIVVSSVSVDQHLSNGHSVFRLKRAGDAAAVCPSPINTVPTSTIPFVANTPGIATADATIIILINAAPGADAHLAEAIDRGLAHGTTSGAAIGFTRAIPESALPAVREVYAMFRNQCGYGGSITALAVEKLRTEDTRSSRGTSDVRDRTSLEFQELSVDPARREVWVEGSLIGLTKSEFDLLYVLSQRPGVVFSRRQIVLAYKGADYPVDDRSIDVQMFNLRRKIRSAGSVLQTIRGVGYRFTGTLRS